MPTESLSCGMKTEGSYVASPSDPEIQAWSELGFQDSVSVPFARSVFAYEPDLPPVQTAGDSHASRQIQRYLSAVFAGFSSLATNAPRIIRMIASPEARAASVDPWKVKNDRRLDLLAQKFSIGLDANKEAELERLKHEIYDRMQAIDPRPAEDLNEIDARFEKVKKRIEAKRGKKGNDSGTV